MPDPDDDGFITIVTPAEIIYGDDGSVTIGAPIATAEQIIEEN